MKIRTHEQLFDLLTNEIAWRKKELSDFKSLIETKDFAPSKHHALVRAGIMLLYAHWEGFVKQCAEYYLNYVSMQRLPYKELASNFIAICVKSEMNDLENSNRVSHQLKLVEFFLNDLSKQSSMPYKKVVNTKSNLSSTIFKNIVLFLGFDYSFYETKSVLLDERLLAIRNTIAHGNYMLITASDYLEIHEKVLEMIEYFRNQIDNSASTKAYRRT
jgi:hypothetical protein